MRKSGILFHIASLPNEYGIGTMGKEAYEFVDYLEECGQSFSYSDRTIMHEGAGASSLDIDLEEQLAAAWFVPFDTGANGWSAEPLYNVQNIIWSGLI